MKLQEIVTSQDTGMRLKAAGWTKPTIFMYEGANLRPWPLDYDSELGAITPTWDELLKRKFIFFPAPTAEEILRELPAYIKDEDGDSLRLEVHKLTSAFSIGYCGLNTVSLNKISVAEAAAQMWLWCVKRGYIKPEGKP